MPTEDIQPMHDHTIVVRKDIPEPIEEKEEEVDLDFLTSLTTEGDEDETERPKSNRRKHK